MSYVKKSLAEGETIRSVASYHWSYHLFAWISLFLLGVLLIGVYIFARILIWMKTTEVAVTDRRIIIKRGWLRRSTEELSLASVEEINLRQNFWGRLLNFGELTISGTGAGDLQTPTIARPVEFRRAISDARAPFLPPKKPSTDQLSAAAA